jgi:hypothetical protein
MTVYLAKFRLFIRIGVSKYEVGSNRSHVYSFTLLHVDVSTHLEFSLTEIYLGGFVNSK